MVSTLAWRSGAVCQQRTVRSGPASTVPESDGTNVVVNPSMLPFSADTYQVGGTAPDDNRVAEALLACETSVMT
jgi:hypothetical protein